MEKVLTQAISCFIFYSRIIYVIYFVNLKNRSNLTLTLCNGSPHGL